MQDLRPVTRRLRRQLFDHMAVVNDVNAIGETHRGGDILLDDHDRLARLSEGGEQVALVAGGLRALAYLLPMLAGGNLKAVLSDALTWINADKRERGRRFHREGLGDA